VEENDGEKIRKVELEIRVLRTRAERKRACIYGMGKKGHGKKCALCGEAERICLEVTEKVNNGWGYGYIVYSGEDMEALKRITEVTIESEER